MSVSFDESCEIASAHAHVDESNDSSEQILYRLMVEQSSASESERGVSTQTLARALRPRRRKSRARRDELGTSSRRIRHQYDQHLAGPFAHELVEPEDETVSFYGGEWGAEMSAFSSLFLEQNRRTWEPFRDTTLAEQRELLASIGASNPLERPFDPRRAPSDLSDSDLSASSSDSLCGFSDREFREQIALERAHPYTRVRWPQRRALRAHSDMALLVDIETQVRAFVELSLNDIVPLQPKTAARVGAFELRQTRSNTTQLWMHLDSPLHRLLAHGVCQFYGVESTSCTRNKRRSILVSFPAGCDAAKCRSTPSIRLVDFLVDPNVSLDSMPPPYSGGPRRSEVVAKRKKRLRKKRLKKKKDKRRSRATATAVVPAVAPGSGGPSSQTTIDDESVADIVVLTSASTAPSSSTSTFDEKEFIAVSAPPLHRAVDLDNHDAKDPASLSEDDFELL